jgi:ribosomal protein L30E
MHEIEPYFNWRHLYTAEEDPLSPFYKRTYSEFEFSQTVYNYYIHPQWDDFGSRTLYLKILFTDYEQHFCIIELIGEWNDAIENDIMELKREIIDPLEKQGITKFILIAENVLNFHSSDKEYYQEWYEEVSEENGWIIAINMPEATQQDFKKKKLNYYIELMDIPEWRVYKPEHLYSKIDDILSKRISL